MILAIVAAVLVSFLLYVISYLAVFLIPAASNQASAPTPTASTIDMIFRAVLLIGLAAVIAFTIVVTGLFIDRLRKKAVLNDS